MSRVYNCRREGPGAGGSGLVRYRDVPPGSTWGPLISLWEGGGLCQAMT